MMTIHSPSYDSFLIESKDVDFVPVYRKLISDTLTPVQAFKKLDSSPAACLFESVIGGEKVGRYSFLASAPYCQIDARGTQVKISHLKQGTAPSGLDKNPEWETETIECENPFEVLRNEVQAVKVAHLGRVTSLHRRGQ